MTLEETLENRIVSDIEKAELPKTPLEEFNAAMNVLNLPSKGLTLLALDNTWRTADEINNGPLNRLVPISERNFGEKVTIIEQYCRCTLFPIAAAAKAKYAKKGSSLSRVFSITQFGKKVQKVVAYSILAIQSSQYFKSMFELLGITQSNGTTRQTENIPQILYAIQQGTTNIHEIGQKTGIDEIIVGHNISHLASKGILTKSTEAGCLAKYILLCPDKYHGKKGAIQTIVNIFKENPDKPISISELCTSLTDKYSYALISGAIDSLARRGIIRVLDHVSLTDKGREGISILDKIANYFYCCDKNKNDLSNTQRERLDEVESAWLKYKNDPTFTNSCVAAWNKYGTISPHVNCKLKNERLIDTLNFTYANANKGTTTRDTAKKLGVSTATAHNYLTQLLAMCKIRRTPLVGMKSGTTRGYEYFPVAAQNSIATLATYF